ncbi:PepSY-associated TM helix domain-containing protein [Aliikangiella maris]|uniref:PepSY-associated TM helix domain-containing protein n=2 Tax=Aliikangiella maris TaxID=3162458 RepID=A0ABV2BUD0_9GAMM
MNSRQLHRWLGFSIGLVLSLVCLSGSILLHKQNLLPLVYPELAQAIKQPVKTAAIDPLLVEQLIASQYSQPIAVVLPSQDWPVYTLAYNKSTKAYFNQAGQFLIAIDSQNDWFAWLFELHQNLLLGKSGKQVNGWLQLFTLTLLITGVILWWPKRSVLKSISINIKAPPHKLWYQIHRTLGVLALPALILMILSGVSLLFYTQTKGILTSLFNDKPHQQVQQSQPVNQLKDVIKQAQLTWPDIQWRAIYLPRSTRPHWKMRGKFATEWHRNGRSFITFKGAENNELLLEDARKADTGLAILQKLYPLHSGAIGSVFYRWFLTFIGIVPLILWVSGVYLYILKPRKKRARALFTTASHPL